MNAKKTFGVFAAAILIAYGLSACAQGKVQDSDIARQFLYCSYLDSYAIQITKNEWVKTQAKRSGQLRVNQAVGLTSLRFVEDEMPKALDKFKADWTSAKQSNTLEAYLRKEMDTCLQLDKQHAERALQNFRERPKQN